jgi:hypothetical protein
MKMPILIATLLTVVTWNLHAQTIIKGIVTDASNEKIPLAAVYISKTTIGTITNIDGAYSLLVPQNGEFELISSYLGYKTFSRTITTDRKELIINIKLAEQPVQLDEITVMSRDRNRKAKLELFTKLFLGETLNSQNCKILNPEDLYLYQDAASNLLTGHSLKSLKIENKALGYIVFYDLSDFSYNTQNGVLKYSGPNYFIPMKGNTRKMNKWRINRLATYYGSRMHFLRSLYHDSLKKEKFQMYQVQLDASHQDTLGIFPIYADSLIRVRTDISVTVFSSRPVIVTYDDTHKEFNKGFFGFQPHRFKSTLEFSDSLNVFANGYYFHPYLVTWLGKMSIERVADLLPYDFSIAENPAKMKNQ